MKWIDVRDRLPEEGEYVLAFTEHKEICWGFFGDQGWATFDGHVFPEIEVYSYDNVTHWMPLPEPPK